MLPKKFNSNFKLILQIFFDKLVKSQNVMLPVIPKKAGIRFFPPVISSLDSGCRI